MFAFIAAYYVAILLHEWGHGLVAWLFNVKQSPFDVDYGGWALMHVDENVDYAQLLLEKKRRCRCSYWYRRDNGDNDVGNDKYAALNTEKNSRKQSILYRYVLAISG